MANKILHQYINGDYKVLIFEDGSKIRISNKDNGKANFPESIDIKITNYCDMNCAYCHEKSTTNGKHADFGKFDNFLSTLKKGTELAIGGGNPMADEPNLIKFLQKMKNQGVICNITINQNHLKKKESLTKINKLMNEKLINGLGISLMDTTALKDILYSFDKKNRQFIVIHTIAGIHSIDDFNILADIGNIKTLILGYKTFGRGETYKLKDLNIQSKINALNKKLPVLFEKFDIISFDNLALSQLDIKSLVDRETWNDRYMGNDGTFTMYVDLVTGTYRPSSTSIKIFDLKDNDTSKTIFENILKITQQRKE